jgi:hypothetical protein
MATRKSINGMATRIEAVNHKTGMIKNHHMPKPHEAKSMMQTAIKVATAILALEVALAWTWYACEFAMSENESFIGPPRVSRWTV